MRSEKNERLVTGTVKDIFLGDKAADGAQLRPHIVWFEEAVPMIEPAAAIVQAADIFVVIGTSLVVYPAAGLIHYAQPDIPKFIIDKNIPDTPTVHHLFAIALPATEGVPQLAVALKKYI